jgi:glycosyltransferase involved in cell wall biosynthesis
MIPHTLSVIIPASNEERFIGECLEALMAQSGIPDDVVIEILVAANGCHDGTVAVARTFARRAAAREWVLTALDIPEAGKPNALNRGDAVASGDIRIYLDADVICSPTILSCLVEALRGSEPCYATGKLIVARPRSWFTRRYAAIWTRLPFYTSGAAGAGLFAVNAAGRRRWSEFPAIISDDTYARLLFAPDERIEVDATYTWPMVEGLGNLIRVRRRQDRGVAEVRRLWPELKRNESYARLGFARTAMLLLRDPLGFGVYVTVALASKVGRVSAFPAQFEWERGR